MDGSLTQLLALGVMVLVPLVLSLTVHEYAHAWAARRLGDDTAQQMGRLTLNPVAHADPIGTVLLPLVIIVANGAAGGGVPFFGWAKPVPVNGGRFRREINVRSGMMLVAAAGPLSNLLIAALCAVGWSITAHLGLWPGVPEPIRVLTERMVEVNVALFVFNMIPIHPLDGQKVLTGLLSAPVALRFERWSYQFGWMALMVVIFVAQDWLAVPIWLVQSGLLAAVGLY